MRREILRGSIKRRASLFTYFMLVDNIRPLASIIFDNKTEEITHFDTEYEK